MTETKDVVIRRSVGKEDFVSVPGSVVLEEGAFYIHIDDSNTDIAVPMEVIIDLLKGALMEGLK